MNQRIRIRLFEMQDLAYKNFQCKLMPTINPDMVIGVRTPKLRALAKELIKEEGIEEFLNTLPHPYYEENNLHAFLLEQIGDYSRCMERVNEFLPYVDNWATCDMMRPKCFKKHTEELLGEVETWIASSHTYTIRFGIEMLMSFYLNEQFDVTYPEMVAGVKSEEYYVNMMIAWYFATALAKQYETVLPYIEENCLDTWVHNKTIQKAIESNRITKEQKEYLKTLKRKKEKEERL